MATRKKPAGQGLLVEDRDQSPAAGVAPSPAITANDVSGHNRLRLHRLIAKGFRGLGPEVIVDFDPNVTVLEGENASGKTSRLAALRCALGIDRRTPAAFAHINSDGSLDKAELEVVLLGEDREIHVRRVGDGSPEVRERVGEDWRIVPRPAEWLKGMIDMHGANPDLFLAAKDEDRAVLLLEALDLPTYSRTDALKAAGMEAFRLPPIPDGLHPLEDLERVMDAIFSSRTEVNSQERRESDAAKKLLAGLRAEPPADISKALERCNAAVFALASEIDKQTVAAAGTLNEIEQRVAAAFKAEAARLRADHAAKAAELRAEAERQVANLLAETEAAIATQKTSGEGELQRADAEHTATLVVIESKRKALGERKEELATLRAQETNLETDRRLRATAKEARELAATHKARADELTAGLEGLKRYRAQLTAALPIKGLEVHFDDGKTVMTLDGVPLSMVNEGRMHELAAEVSVVRGAAPADPDRPYLPLILCDWIEKLDRVHQVALLGSLAARGAQVVAAAVGSSPLTVRHGDAALEPRAVA